MKEKRRRIRKAKRKNIKINNIEKKGENIKKVSLKKKAKTYKDLIKEKDESQRRKRKKAISG